LTSFYTKEVEIARSRLGRLENNAIALIDPRLVQKIVRIFGVNPTEFLLKSLILWDIVKEGDEILIYEHYSGELIFEYNKNKEVDKSAYRGLRMCGRKQAVANSITFASIIYSFSLCSTYKESGKDLRYFSCPACANKKRYTAVVLCPAGAILALNFAFVRATWRYSLQPLFFRFINLSIDRLIFFSSQIYLLY